MTSDSIEQVDTLYTWWDYDWSVIGLWTGPQGYYLGTDSGCSCYSPWENYDTGDLTGPLTAEQAREEITSLANVDGQLASTTSEELAQFLEHLA